MNKCDFCNKEAVAYGSYHCYSVCEDHIKKGEQVEQCMWDEIAKHNPNGEDLE